MASTRNINQPGDYFLEEFSYLKQTKYYTFIPSTVPVQTCFPGDGLLAGQVGNPQLATNAVDIETALYGIGSNNLVKPQPPVVPHIRQLDTLDIFTRLPVFLPEPLVVEKGQRLRFFK